MRMNLWYFMLKISGINNPKGTNANRFAKLKTHDPNRLNRRCFGNHNGIPVA